ncbi:MAG: hypothetical protein KJZ47_12335 [Gemmatimonadales bacterium]|nr:hypothetical protein [Gemmatimonadales bacterium]
MCHLTRRAVLLVVLTLATLPVAGEAQRRERNRITQEELAAEKSQGTTFEMVRVLRPQWFREGGARQLGGSGSSTMQATPILYIDGVRMDALQLMNSVPLGRIKEIRYLAPRDAHTRFGMGHEGGVIEMELVKVQPDPPGRP